MGWAGGKGKNERALSPKETALIKKVFQHANLPSLLEVTIADGLSVTKTAWTDSDYQINVGPTLFAEDLADKDPALLVHEMVHVWQYKNGALTKAYALAAHAVYGYARRTNDLYDYNLGDSWDSFGFEGQAQLVEDWFSPPNYEHPDGSNMGRHSLRFPYVDRVLRGSNPRLGQLTLDELLEPMEGIAPMPAATLQVSVPIDVVILPLLKLRFRANDVAGYRDRAMKLEQIFGGYVYAFDRKVLFERLKTRRAGDKVSEYFYDHLSSALRNRLLGLLK